ncbi:hypothetical protein [Actinomadura sp. WMMB 499]|uniref:hypothetical protein n=1 Tax=Actinomadura sp. WMMB 499 TaxID=1219491 RepID=UPI001245AD4B|nr:hypothetical protein [Actinomadura sp. WMMB 499]QFG19964.1 hypothetical protein F7P10_01090 [Actinomadura sp. WMMB 499]
MRTIGTIVAIVGLASLANHAVGGEQMEVLDWSSEHQPAAGIGLLVLGLLVLAAGSVLHRDR